MAGKSDSRKNAKNYSGLWTTYILVFSLLVFLSGCVNQQGYAFSDNISPEQKKVELKERLKRRYNDPQAHFLLAQLYQADRSWDDAEFYYNNSLRFDPVYMPAQVGMVKLFLDRSDALKAQHYFENYLNLAGEKPSNIVKLGREFQDQGVDSYAMACFDKALAIAPKSAEVHKYLGYFYLRKNDRNKAIDHFEESFNIDSTQKDVSRELGILGVPVVYDGKAPVTGDNK
jgi:tetratricopeptide (TPR) repeat protein